jgi:hypothetical protein
VPAVNGLVPAVNGLVPAVNGLARSGEKRPRPFRWKEAPRTPGIIFMC